MVRLQLMFSKISSLNSIFQDLSHGILYFSVDQKIVDFLIFTCLRIFRNFLYLRNRQIWKTMEKCGKFTEYNVLGTVQDVLQLCRDYKI